jgi:uncharacterized protein YndB with AHSA1/START domain
MRWLVASLLVVLVLLPNVCFGQEPQVQQRGPVKVVKTYQPERRLDFEVEVPAPLDQVWTALTTSEGLITWLTPEATVHFGKGGDWIAGFPGVAPGGGTILDFEKGKSITIAALAPETFPTVRKERTRAVFEVSAIGDGSKTLVHLSQTGWKPGEEWDRAFDYLAGGNASLLASLQQRFIKGPVDWAALMKKR